MRRGDHTTCFAASNRKIASLIYFRLWHHFTTEFGTAKKSIFIQIYVYFTAILGTDYIVADFITIQAPLGAFFLDSCITIAKSGRKWG